MNTLRKYTPFFTSALLMYIVLFIIYPHYQYYIDPDGTAYLTISQRYADGDYAKAINGYWSPWSCWLTALLIKGGINVIPASWLVNIAGATGFLYISQSFFIKFNIISKLQWLLNITLALFLCYAVFWQSFDDLWECFFLLATLRIMLADAFTKQPILWVACGVIGTLAYFAKAYSFPFFILNTLCCVYLITRGNRKKWLQISFTSITVMFVCSLPWIITLHNKYHIWTTSTAGPLNMSWYLLGHPIWKDGVGLLLPPVYPDSPSYWEDPWFANGPTPHVWDSWFLVWRQILRIGLNCWKFLLSNMQLSVFFPFIIVSAFLSLFYKKVRSLFHGPYPVLVLSFLLFPLAYFLVNFESRYLWYMLPLGMVIGTMMIQYKMCTTLMVICALTFLIYPAWCLHKTYNVGEAENKIAQKLKEMKIIGSFTSIVMPGLETQRMQRIACFSGNSFYSIPKQGITHEQLLMEMRRYHVNYYLIYDDSSYADELVNTIFLDEKGLPIQGVYFTIAGVRGGIKVYKVN